MSGLSSKLSHPTETKNSN